MSLKQWGGAGESAGWTVGFHLLVRAACSGFARRRLSLSGGELNILTFLNLPTRELG
jgi:hypothetical protein